jgi:hypothetical protein
MNEKENEGLEYDKFVYIIAEFIEHIFTHRSMCKVMGYDMDALDEFIAKKWQIEKERFDNMSVEQLCSIIAENTKQREAFFDEIKNSD